MHSSHLESDRQVRRAANPDAAFGEWTPSPSAALWSYGPILLVLSLGGPSRW